MLTTFKYQHGSNSSYFARNYKSSFIFVRTFSISYKFHSPRNSENSIVNTVFRFQCLRAFNLLGST